MTGQADFSTAKREVRRAVENHLALLGANRTSRCACIIARTSWFKAIKQSAPHHGDKTRRSEKLRLFIASPPSFPLPFLTNIPLVFGARAP